MTHGALKVIRPVVRAGSAVAPRLVGDAAFRLFCTPAKPKGLTEAQQRLTSRALMRLEGGERRVVRFSGTTFPGGEIVTWRFASRGGSARGLVALVHGWTSRAAFMTAFVDPLCEAGFDVVALDLPGHGESPGRALHVPLGVAALSALQGETGPWAGVVAHSFGGALALSAASGAVAGFAPLTVGKLALLSSPHSMPALFRQFGGMIGLSARGQGRLEEHVLRLAGHPLATFECDRMLAALDAPTLVLHAPDDREVAFASAQAFAAAGGHVTLRSLPGLGHRRILHAPEAVQAVGDFLSKA